jgi:anhydro-N-acetylmuramic acid kinase
MKMYRAIGLMSGSSLDGLDVALCTFNRYNNKWIYKIVFAETFRYGGQLYKQLKSASTLSGFELQKLNRDFGKFSAECVNTFIKTMAFIKKL